MELWGPQESVDMVVAQRRLDVRVGEHRLLKVLETTPGATRRPSGRARYWQGTEVPQL